MNVHAMHIEWRTNGKQTKIPQNLEEWSKWALLRRHRVVTATGTGTKGERHHGSLWINFRHIPVA